MNKIKQINARPNQTIWDVVLEQYGSIEAVFEVVELNEQIDNINYNLTIAEELNISKKPFNTDVISYYQNKNIHPASMILIENEGAYSNAFSNAFNI